MKNAFASICFKGKRLLNVYTFLTEYNFVKLYLSLLTFFRLCRLFILSVAFDLYSLKRKSTTMAKRQSIILETKPFHANKPMPEHSHLPSKSFR